MIISARKIRHPRARWRVCEECHGPFAVGEPQIRCFCQWGSFVKTIYLHIACAVPFAVRNPKIAQALEV